MGHGVPCRFCYQRTHHANLSWRVQVLVGYAVPRHAMPCHAAPYQATPRHTTSYSELLSWPCLALPRHAMPCYKAPCWAALRRAAPRCALCVKHLRTYARGRSSAAPTPTTSATRRTSSGRSPNLGGLWRLLSASRCVAHAASSSLPSRSLVPSLSLSPSPLRSPLPLQLPSSSPSPLLCLLPLGMPTQMLLREGVWFPWRAARGWVRPSEAVPAGPSARAPSDVSGPPPPRTQSRRRLLRCKPRCDPEVEMRLPGEGPLAPRVPRPAFKQGGRGGGREVGKEREAHREGDRPTDRPTD